MSLIDQLNTTRRDAAELPVVCGLVSKGLVFRSALPDGQTTVVVRPDDAALKAAPLNERCKAMGDLFTGLTQAINLGARVDISDPSRIVVSKPNNWLNKA